VEPSKNSDYWRYCRSVPRLGKAGEPVDPAAVRALAALEDPTRYDLYAFVRAAGGAVTREEAAHAVGTSRKLAAFHLDKLVAVGLLTADFDVGERVRTVGRVPKMYRVADVELIASIPERQPGVIADVLVDAVLAAEPGESAHDAAMRIAESRGRELGAATRGQARAGRLGAERALTLAETALRARGFEPARTSESALQLRNCPFQPLAQRATDFVCGLNHRMLTGFVAGLQTSSVQAVLAPRPGHCCVELRATTPS
jgi:predicted ArsR family transcriptional regulator